MQTLSAVLAAGLSNRTIVIGAAVVVVLAIVVVFIMVLRSDNSGDSKTERGLAYDMDEGPAGNNFAANGRGGSRMTGADALNGGDRYGAGPSRTPSAPRGGFGEAQHRPGDFGGTIGGTGTPSRPQPQSPAWGQPAPAGRGAGWNDEPAGPAWGKPSEPAWGQPEPAAPQGWGRQMDPSPARGPQMDQPPAWGQQPPMDQAPAWGQQPPMDQAPAWGQPPMDQPQGWGQPRPGTPPTGPAAWGAPGTDVGPPPSEPLPPRRSGWNDQSAAPAWPDQAPPSQPAWGQPPVAAPQAPAWGQPPAGSPAWGPPSGPINQQGPMAPPQPGPMGPPQQPGWGAPQNDPAAWRGGPSVPPPAPAPPAQQPAWGQPPAPPQPAWGQPPPADVARNDGRSAVVIIREGKEQGRTFDLRRDRLTIGRSRESDVFLEDLAVSRLHASIYRDDQGSYILRDENSANGTTVNGQRVTEHRLNDGDDIQVGQTTLTFTRR